MKLSPEPPGPMTWGLLPSCGVLNVVSTWNSRAFLALLSSCPQFKSSWPPPFRVPHCRWGQHHLSMYTAHKLPPTAVPTAHRTSYAKANYNQLAKGTRGRLEEETFSCDSHLPHPSPRSSSPSYTTLQEGLSVAGEDPAATAPICLHYKDAMSTSATGFSTTALIPATQLSGSRTDEWGMFSVYVWCHTPSKPM